MVAVKQKRVAVPPRRGGAAGMQLAFKGQSLAGPRNIPGSR